VWWYLLHLLLPLCQEKASEVSSLDQNLPSLSPAMPSLFSVLSGLLVPRYRNQKYSQKLWYIPVIPATQEAEVGGYQIQG
jgi:hypothetical protein